MSATISGRKNELDVSLLKCRESCSVRFTTQWLYLIIPIHANYLVDFNVNENAFGNSWLRYHEQLTILIASACLENKYLWFSFQGLDIG